MRFNPAETRRVIYHNVPVCQMSRKNSRKVTLVGGSSLAGIAVGQQNIIDCLTNLGFLEVYSKPLSFMP